MATHPLEPMRAEIVERGLRSLKPEGAEGASEFRLWVTELASFFERVQRSLSEEEAALSTCDRAAREVGREELLKVASAAIARRMQSVNADLGRFLGDPANADLAQRRAFLEQSVGRFFDCSPFLHRAKSKPLGYAGDYELMNMLSRDGCEGASLFGKAMNLYATQQASARANVNRIGYLSDKIKHAIDSKPSARVRVVGIGCGPAKELERFLTEHSSLGERLEVALLDHEPGAIAQCERTLGPLALATGAQVRFLQASARRLLTDGAIAGCLANSDLVYSPGLFDYLADRSFSALLSVLYRSLSADGSLVIGNVAADSPDRYVLAYLANWYLHHRTADDLLRLASQLTPSPRDQRVEVEASGVNLFLVVQR